MIFKLYVFCFVTSVCPYMYVQRFFYTPLSLPRGHDRMVVGFICNTCAISTYHH